MHLLDLDQTRPKLGGRSDISGVGEGARSLDNGGNGQAEHQVLLEGKVGGESDSAVGADLGAGDGLDDGDILLVDQDQAEALVLGPLRVGTGGGEGELQLLVLGLDVRGEDVQSAEDGEVDGVAVGAGAGDDEVLVQSREGEFTGRGSQERSTAGDEAKHVTIEAVLFAFLANDGGDTGDETAVTVLAEEGLNITERAQDEVSESEGQGDGILECGDWGLVCAGLDRAGVEMGEGTVGVQRVQFFLSLDCGDGINDGLSLVLVLELVAVDIVGDVEEELGEVRNLEYFIEGDESQRSEIIGGRSSWRRWAVGESTVSLLVDGIKLRRRVVDVREPVG